MTFTDAAREVLRLEGRPLHYKEITEIAIEQNLLSHVGKSPEVTMGARLAATLKKGGEENPLVRVKPGVFALRDWDDETIQRGLQITRPPRRPEAAPSGEGNGDLESGEDGDTIDLGDDGELGEPDDELEAPVRYTGARDTGEDSEPGVGSGRDDDAIRVVSGDDDSAEDDEENGRSRARRAVDVRDVPRSPDEEMRAEIVASAGDLFAEEDDDDQPILRPLVVDEEEGDGRRRRRRRRRRGSRKDGSDNGQTLPSYTATPMAGTPNAATPMSGTPAAGGGAARGRNRGSGDLVSGVDDAGPRGPQVIEVTRAELPVLDGLAGAELADAVELILGTFDRGVGAVSLRQIAETAQRKGKLGGEVQLAQSQIAAAVRADASRRSQSGIRPRFRVAGGRVGLTSWLLDGELQRAQAELDAALGRYRDAAARAFARKCGELPGHAFVELCVTLLERLGVSDLAPIRLAGGTGAEAHFSAKLHLPAGAAPGQMAVGSALKLALVIRKDGRDVGRERVTELRGSLHHYDGADSAWIFTAGQVLSGARDESAIEGAAPVSILDGQTIARLCEQHDVAVIRATNAVAIADVDLFEALRSS